MKIRQLVVRRIRIQSLATCESTLRDESAADSTDL